MKKDYKKVGSLEETKVKIRNIARYEQSVRDMFEHIPEEIALNAVINAAIKMCLEAGMEKNSFINQISNGWDYIVEE